LKLSTREAAAGCVAMIAVRSSTLVGQVAVAVAVKGQVHDDDHD
jgi:hypothetical protein